MNVREKQLEGEDREFKKNSREVADRDPALETSVDKVAAVDTAPLFNQELNKPPEDLLKCDLSKPQGRLYYIRHLIKSYYYYYSKSVASTAEARRFHKWCFSKVMGNHTSSIMRAIIDLKATTFKELTAVTKASDQMIIYILKEMKRWGLIESKAYVKPPYIELKGREPKIFSTIDASYKDLVEAQRRYAVQTLGYDPYEQEQRRKAQMAEEAEQTRLEAIEIRVQADQVQRYVDAIAPHLEPCHAAPTRENRQIIEAYMREQGVPEPIWVQVREGVRNLCRRPKGERGR